MQSEFNVPKHALKLTLILRLHLATVATVASWDWCDCHSSPHTQAVYVPADDLTDPAPATTFAHLDATTVLSRQIAEPPGKGYRQF